jgi:hypothetical protein
MVLPGFNTDFKYRGQVYHAQTEDNGLNNPVVVTLLYLKGAILASKKTPYGNLLEKADFQGDLLDMMKLQHRGIMKEVLAGKYAPPAAGPPSAPASAIDGAGPAATGADPSEEPKSLDRAIIEFLDGVAAGSQP